MISCIICSRKSDISEELKQNIASTIGDEYELVVVDNSTNKYSILSAYNEGIRRANGSILCFMHEDIIFHTIDWGFKLDTILREESIGVVGVIGSQFLPNKMASWFLCENTKGVILQGDVVEGKYFSTQSGVEIDVVTDVVVLDGLWLAMRREIVLNIRFDDNTFNSFHCYDIDICMQLLSLGKRVVVVPDILIEHKSMGNLLTDYYQQLQCFFTKWKNELPIWRGIILDESTAIKMSNILGAYQRVVCRNIMLEHSWSYRLGKLLLSPLKKIGKIGKSILKIS